MEYRHEIMNMADYTIENELIEDMQENIFTELDCSKKYAMNALRHKAENKATADKEIAMSAEELGHATMIKDKIEKTLEKLKDEKHQCYDWLALSWFYAKHRAMGYMDWILSLHERYKKQVQCNLHLFYIEPIFQILRYFVNHKYTMLYRKVFGGFKIKYHCSKIVAGT